MASLLPFFADALPPITTDEWNHGLHALLIGAVIIYAASTIWKNLRPEPSLEKQIDAKIASATTALEIRIENRLRELSSQIGKRENDISELRHSMEKAISDLNRAIGKLEGRTEDHQ